MFIYIFFLQVENTITVYWAYFINLEYEKFPTC